MYVFASRDLVSMELEFEMHLREGCTSYGLVGRELAYLSLPSLKDQLLRECVVFLMKEARCIGQRYRSVDQVRETLFSFLLSLLCGLTFCLLYMRDDPWKD